MGITKRTVIIRWVEGKNKWHMLDEHGMFIEEFHDCRNFNWWFPHPNYERDKRYVMTQAYSLE